MVCFTLTFSSRLILNQAFGIYVDHYLREYEGKIAHETISILNIKQILTKAYPYDTKYTDFILT